jgi:hypothetical protein
MWTGGLPSPIPEELAPRNWGQAFPVFAAGGANSGREEGNPGESGHGAF